ncbi:glycosyltransferase family A protein [Arthrobacter sp. E3]|uniref:glycosyltransferase family 2 protein n=1 Tax=Arthrobacter sp. E3 TaxID=517402 RepID=UPI001FFD00FB|nr:glycosyltransferase family A protein [Arthrobacter sp. E3]
MRGPHVPTGHEIPTQLPDVGVVLATHNRPVLMRRALESILAQDYAGRIFVMVVHDKCDLDETLASTNPARTVEVVENGRTSGLAGARNTGVLALKTPLVAFCDDDDTWYPQKLTRQVAALQAVPDAEFCSTAMLVDYNGNEAVRVAGTDSVSHEDLLRSRMSMVHSSSFLIKRQDLIDGIGLVDETIPNSMCEDWDLLLRASTRKPIVNVDEPLVKIQWGGTSFFYQQWDVKNTAHKWMLERHPDILGNAVGRGRIYGQLAFGHAALGQPQSAFRWAARSLRANVREPRAVLAMLVAARLVSAETVVDRLQRKGRGI